MCEKYQNVVFVIFYLILLTAVPNTQVTVSPSSVQIRDITVLTATGEVNGKCRTLAPYRIQTAQPIAKNVTVDYVYETKRHANLGANPSTVLLGIWMK